MNDGDTLTMVGYEVERGYAPPPERLPVSRLKPLRPRPRLPLRPRSRGDQLLRTGHLLTLSSLATSAIGLLYWASATRTYGAATVGTSYAAVSALSFLAGVGQFNLGNVLIRFVPSAGSRLRRLVLGSYAAAALGTLVAATVFVLLIPAISPGLAFLRAPALAAAFVLGTVAYSVFTLQDGVLTGLRRPGWLLTENFGFAVLKVGLLVALAGTALRAQGILLSWVAALVAAIAVTNGVLFTRLIRRGRPRSAPPAVRAIPTVQIVSPRLRYIAADYAGELLWMATMSLPPIMVLNLLGPEQGAYYGLAWLIAHTLYMVSINMGLSLMVETAREPDRIDRLRHMLKHTGPLLAGGVAVTIAAAPLILRVFGAGYAHGGSTLLRLMALSALPNLVIVAAVSIARTRQLMWLVVAVYATFCALVLGLTGVLTTVMGIAGAGVAWLTGSTVVAGVLLLRRDLWVPRATADNKTSDNTASDNTASDKK
jgi:O-antigen/teichoic acid export membrane protein